MIKYRVLKTILLGVIDPTDDQQHDVLIRPDGASIGFDGKNILVCAHDGRWIETITVNYAIEEWLKDGSVESLEQSSPRDVSILT